MAVRVERKTQRFLKSVLRAHHFIGNNSSKSPVPVYCLFVFACFFFLLWYFFLHFRTLCLYSRLRVLKQGQKMNIPKINGRI